MALALPSVVEVPHFGKRAFRVDAAKGTIFATLWEEDARLSLKLTPPAQRAFANEAPKVFHAIANKWGERGWTWCELRAATKRDLAAALALAREMGAPKPSTSRARAKRPRA